MDYLQRLETLRSSLPQSVLDVLDAAYSKTLLLSERYRDLLDLSFVDVVASLNLQTALPPLITILTIYFAIVSLYRTTSFFIRITFFFVKWGALLGFLVIGLGSLFKVTMPEAYRDLTSGNMRQGSTHRTRRPRIWDSFEAHQKWRNAQDDNSFVAQEIVDKIVDTARQVGVRNVIGTLSGFMSKGSDPSMQQETSKGITGKSRGKAKIR